MANQLNAARFWSRFASTARQPDPQVPAAKPQPEPQSRPPVARPTFRPVALPQPQPQPPQTEPITRLPITTPKYEAHLAPASPAAPTAPTLSVPTSQGQRDSAPSSLPTSLAPINSTAVLPANSTSSVPSSHKPQVSALNSSFPSSPASKPATTPTSVPSSSSIRAAKVSSSLPMSPATKTVDSIPSSPTPKTATPTTVTARVASLVQPSPRTLKPTTETPPQSPKPKQTAPSLSQIKTNAEHESKIPTEAEQKDVLVQKTIEEFNGDTHKHSNAHTGKQGEAKEAYTTTKSHQKKFFSSDTEEGGTRVITIAGENKGAFLEVIKSAKKNGFEGTSSHLIYKKGNPGGTLSNESMA